MNNTQRFLDHKAPRSLTNILVLIATLTPIAFSIIPPAQAELPPGSYDKLRISADAALIIQVIKVDKKPSSNPKFTTVSVKAKVVAVQRSKTGIKPGNEILIQYESLNPNINMPGPRRIAVLAAGEYYPAFLNGSQKVYTPAAHGESFRMTPDM